MTNASRPALPTIRRNRSILPWLAMYVLVAAVGCGGIDAGAVLGSLGGMVATNGGVVGTSLGGAAATFGGASNGGAATSATGGSTNSVQSGGVGVGGATVQNGGATANGGTSLQGGVTNVGGAKATGGVTSNGGTATGGKATGGVPAAGGTATGGSATIGGNASTGGAKATGGAAMGGSATGGVKATGGTTSSGGATATGGSAGTFAALTIYLAGDSTVSNYTDTAATNDQAGWGQMLHEIFNTNVTVVNRAAGGRTAFWFYLEGAVASILNVIKPGDYFFIQFGTNDQNTTATFVVNGTTYPRFADAQTTFKTQLKQYYLDPIKAKGAIPVLVTPPPRNSAYCNGGNGLGGYATAMIQLGAVENVAVVDNNIKTFNYLKAICPAPVDAAAETFFKNTGGVIDGTHFQENGARKMAGFIGEEITRLHLGLAAYLL